MAGLQKPGAAKQAIKPAVISSIFSKSIRNPSKWAHVFSKPFEICTLFFEIGLLNSKSVLGQGQYKKWHFGNARYLINN